MGALTATHVLADAGSQSGGSPIGSLLIFALFGVVLYFLLIRPQRKRQQEQQKLVQSLAVGADVVTIGGLHGTVEELGDDWVDLVVSGDGTVLRFQRQAIARRVDAPAPAESDGDE